MGKRPGITDNSILFRVLVSFFMAVVLFVHAPLEAEAKSHSNNGLSVEVLNSAFQVTLEGAHDQNGTSNYGSYEGDFTLSFRYNCSRPYMSGLVIFPVTLSLGGMVNSVSVSLASTSLPPEFSVAPMGTMSKVANPVGPTSLTFNLNVNTMGFFFSGFLDFSVTFHVQATCMPGSGALPSVMYGSFGVPVNRAQFFYVTYDALSDMRTPLAAIYNAIGLCSTYISNVFTAVQNNTSSTATWLEMLVKHSDSNSKAEIQAIAEARQALVNELQLLRLSGNSNAHDIMHGYDKSDQDSDNERFESSRQELQEQEDSLFSSATEGFGSLDMGDYGIGKFSAMQGAFSFVSGFIQSCYVKMGDFGAVVTVGLVLLIATKVIGLFRFQVVEH